MPNDFSDVGSESSPQRYSARGGNSHRQRDFGDSYMRPVTKKNAWMAQHNSSATHERRYEDDDEGDDAKKGELVQHLADEGLVKQLGREVLHFVHAPLDHNRQGNQHDHPAAKPGPVKISAFMADGAGVVANLAGQQEECVRIIHDGTRGRGRGRGRAGAGGGAGGGARAHIAGISGVSDWLIARPGDAS